MSFKGKENVYTCQKCGGYTVTIDIDEGVTPFMLDCRASGREGDCEGDAYSAFYPKGPRPARIPPPAWEWYKPTDDEVAKMPASHRYHYEQGGLAIRKMGESRAIPAMNIPPGYYRDKHGSLRRSI